jgi:hypothetical protein
MVAGKLEEGNHVKLCPKKQSSMTKNAYQFDKKLDIGQ